MSAPQVGDKWFRLRDVRYASPLDEFEREMGPGRMEVVTDEYEVARVTPKGVWLRRVFGDFRDPDLRFVRLDARKRFACPTKEEALESFLARKKAQARIYSARLHDAERAMALARGSDLA